MMKFDFSINENKRMEIKSTIKTSRTHHFKHDQLLSELYDIRIVSVMLQKNDYGESLGELIEQIRDKFADNYALLIHSTMQKISRTLMRKLRTVFSMQNMIVLLTHRQQ